VVTATQADHVCPLFQPHFRPGLDPSTLKRGRVDGESSHGNHSLGNRESPWATPFDEPKGKKQSNLKEPARSLFSSKSARFSGESLGNIPATREKFRAGATCD
jgi:hypothetical protein